MVGKLLSDLQHQVKVLLKIPAVKRMDRILNFELALETLRNTGY